MAKKIRFSLDMGNGIEVRTLEELQNNFSLEKVFGYYVDGKLITWLRDRYLDDLADGLDQIDKEDPNIAKKICSIFGVEYSDEINLQSAEIRNHKKSLLKEYAVDDKWFEVIDDIAFDQDSFYDLLDEGKNEIYLCGKQFSIPLSKHNMKYVGVNRPIVVINSKEIIDFSKRNILFDNVNFDDEYQHLLNNVKKNDDQLAYSDLIDDFNNLRGTNLVKRIESEITKNTVLADKARYMLYQMYRHVPKEVKNITLDAITEIKKAAEHGYEAAKIRCSMDFGMFNEEYTDREKSSVDEAAYRKHCCELEYLERLDEEDCFILYEVGVAHLIANATKAIEFIKKSAFMNCWLAERSMGIRYQNGDSVAKDFSLANDWYKKSANKGIAKDCWEIAWNSLFNLYNDQETACKYINLAFDDKEFVQQQYQVLKNMIMLKQYPNCFFSMNNYFGYVGSGTKTELQLKLDKDFKKWSDEVEDGFNGNHESFQNFCNAYIQKYNWCLRTKMMMAYGEKEKNDIFLEENNYAEDIRKVLLDLLQNYRRTYSLSDLYDEDYSWTDCSIGKSLFSQKEYMLSVNSGYARVSGDFREQIKKYSEKAHEVMKDYFAKTLL